MDTKRLTAKKISISELMKGKFVKKYKWVQKGGTLQTLNYADTKIKSLPTDIKHFENIKPVRIEHGTYYEDG